MDALLNISPDTNPGSVNAVFDDLKPDTSLQEACEQLCQEFPDLFKQELGCLKDFELNVQFKDGVQPIYVKPRTVAYAVEEDLNLAYDAGIS